MGGKRNRNKNRHAQQQQHAEEPPRSTGGRGAARSTASSSSDRHEHERAEHDDYPDDDLDFCQRFFGDPLFSNLNVSLLFLTATFLPMIVWIPHFLSECRA